MPIDRGLLRQSRLVPEDLQQSPEDLLKAVEGGGLYAAEYRIDLAGGVHRWIAASGMGMTDPVTGEVTQIVGTLQDITQRKVQEQSLRQSDWSPWTVRWSPPVRATSLRASPLWTQT